MIFCKQCGFSVKEGAVFCQSCGADMRTADEPVKPELRMPNNAAPRYEETKQNKCIRCGAVLPDGAVFCSHCGSRQEEYDQAEPVNRTYAPEYTEAYIRPQNPVQRVSQNPQKQVQKKQVRKKHSKRKKKGTALKAILGITAAVMVIVATVIIFKIFVGNKITEVEKALVNLITADSFQMKMSMTSDGNYETNTETKITYIYDEETKEVKIFVDSSSSSSIGSHIINTNDQILFVLTEQEVFLVAQDGSDGEYITSSLENEKGWELLNAVREQNDEVFYKDIQELMDSAEEASDMEMPDVIGYSEALCDAFSKKDVLVNVLGYERNKSNGKVTYTFNPNFLETIKLFTDTSEGYLSDDMFEMLENFCDEAEDAEDELDDIKFKIKADIEDNYLTSLSLNMTLEKITDKFDVTFSKYNTASLSNEAKAFEKAYEEYRAGLE